MNCLLVHKFLSSQKLKRHICKCLLNLSYTKVIALIIPWSTLAIEYIPCWGVWSGTKLLRNISRTLKRLDGYWTIASYKDFKKALEI